ncbi:ATP-binding protein [Desulfobulbus alkaliphilus]|uniref:ATP-binding protein n=1 Tax=Desulfobulbus alkaliphilus TaxID=869814 RepID=UPI001966545A|nr:AAA family ATPase [Desulfobulbus alkaliphilus]MBM9535467.1 ATP-binding protein [Desulfobulbus alkaliphilus]
MDIDHLITLSRSILQRRKEKYRRFLHAKLNPHGRLVGIKGPRGAGKTTLVRQLLQESGLAAEKALYVTADHPRVNAMRLYDIAEAFEKLGGQLLVIDEIHKQSGFAADLKAVYDTLSLRVIFTGSSALHLDHAKVDLSRRAVIYNLPCLSLREFVELETGLEFAALDLATLVQDHAAIAGEIVTRLADRRILPLYRDYLTYGAYPFYREGVVDYPIKLIEVVRQMIDSDLAVIYNIDKDHLNKLNRILELICRSPPLELKVTKLAGAARINIRTLYAYLGYLEKGSLVRTVPAHKSLAKADKLYFDNPNLFSILCDYPQQGAIRETFAATMLGNAGHRLHYPARGDFLVDERHLFEVGGKNKDFNQISGIKDSFDLRDNEEYGIGNKIPLWLLGFLY